MEDLPLRLQLQHQAMVAQPQTALILQGQVTTFSHVQGLSTVGLLWVQLRDPETGEILHRESQSLAIAPLPSRFDCPISLPENITVRLLVGEMSLWSATHPPQVLAIQGFTVTLNLDALLEDVANQGEQSAATMFEDLATVAAPPKPLASLPPRQVPFQRIYLPSNGLTLPPVIYSPIDSKGVGSPSLPTFANQPIRRKAAREGTPTTPAKSLSLPPLGNSAKRQHPSQQPPLQAKDTGQPPSTSGVELPLPGRSPQTFPDAPATTDETAAATAASPQEMEKPPFQPDFQGRFWSRLSALAHEAQETAANLKAQMESAGVEAIQEMPPLEVTPLQSPSFPEESQAFNHEVVIYDSDPEEHVTSEITSEASENDLLTTATAAETAASEDDPENLPAIPIPQLNLPEGELIAGNPLPITVRLPLYSKRLAVKVWVTDIQSRSLADRPRWLMNWTPTHDGEQTALLQLQVPQGSLEARFEAIAIDLTTQRESYKTTLVRTIVPPDLPEANIVDPL
ncbi:MAG: hypothetical protein F6K42_32035 [Leptolyngbya sp. SIO1D8]|nr:hypothetical protein [Leptolyngbya sp. SIO1D8]